MYVNWTPGLNNEKFVFLSNEVKWKFTTEELTVNLIINWTSPKATEY